MTIGSKIGALKTLRALARADRTAGAALTAIRDRRLAVCPSVEWRRQRAVTESGLLDTARESRFDIIVEMTRDLVGTQSAAFSLIDRNRSWRKSRIEVAEQEINRGDSLCSAVLEYAAAEDAVLPRRRIASEHAARSAPASSGLLVVTDARIDNRFSTNPHVVRRPGIVSYVGVPIRAANGERIGVLCAFDSHPRVVSAVTCVLLMELGALLEVEVQRPVGPRPSGTGGMDCPVTS